MGDAGINIRSEKMWRGTQLISLAYDWYQRGYTPIPLYHASKHPAILWKAWALARPDWNTVVREFATPFYRNLGLLVGGGLVVLDFDTPLPYVRWKRATGLDSYIVRTGRGYHVYVLLDEPPTTTLSMAGGEVKASGYVVAPPSTHPNGVIYTPLANGWTQPRRCKNLHALGVLLALQTKTERTTVPVKSSEQSSEPGSLIERIKQAYPLTSLLSRYTQLRPSGDDFLLGVCPFHNDTNPSLWVNARLQICGCFAPDCPAHTHPLDVINAYGLLTGIRNGEAIVDLARQLEL